MANSWTHANFQNPRIIPSGGYVKFTSKYIIVGGEGKNYKRFLGCNLILLVTHSSMPNFRTQGQPSFGEKYLEQREIEKEKTVNYGHYVLPAMAKGRACTLLGPIHSACNAHGQCMHSARTNTTPKGSAFTPLGPKSSKYLVI